ncbi:putative Phytocyanin domain, cupredoxin [Helianthus debilis subsp. tardiflorus]
MAAAKLLKNTRDKKMGAFKFNMFVFMAIVASMTFCSSAMEHAVGDDSGWVTPENPNFYADWAAKNTFTVGDTLLFDFYTGLHDVTPVIKEDYDRCSVTVPGATIKTGPATLNLYIPGDHYFISSMDGDCLYNQKLAIHVVDNDLSN